MSSFSAIGKLPNKEEIIACVNKSFDDLFHYNADGERKLMVCSICNEILMHEKDVNYVSLNILEKTKLIAWKTHYTTENE